MLAKRAAGIAISLVISLGASACASGHDDDDTIASDGGSNQATTTSQTPTSDGTHPSTTDGGGPSPSTRGPRPGPGPGPTDSPPGPQGTTEAEQIARLIELLGAGVFESPGGAEIQLMCPFYLRGESILREMSSLLADGKVDPATVESVPPGERTQLEARWLELVALVRAPRPPDGRSWTPSDRSVGGQGLCLFGMGASPISLRLLDDRGAEITTVSLRGSDRTAVVDTEGGVQGEMDILVHDGNPPLEIVGFATTPNSEHGCFFDDVCDMFDLTSTPGIYPGAQILVIPANDRSPRPASFSATSAEGTVTGSLP